MLLSGEAKTLEGRSRSESESEEGVYSRKVQTRNPVIYPGPGRRCRNRRWRPEPVYVEKCLDEAGVGVKGQSNREIARTPRNAFRGSLSVSAHEVERPIGREGFAAYQVLTNSECVRVLPGSESAGANIRRREGKSPDPRPRPLTAV